MADTDREPTTLGGRSAASASVDDPIETLESLATLAFGNDYELHDGGPAVRVSWNGGATLHSAEKQALRDAGWTIDDRASTSDYYVVRPTDD